MTKRRTMTRNQNHDDGASSSRKRPKSCAPWSDLDHDVLCIVMMQLGVVDYYSLRRVCKSWRSLACKNQRMFMASMPPMNITNIFFRAHEKACHLEDFEGKKLKIILPHYSVGTCIGLTCGYLIFFTNATRDFWLVNPITRKELHFPDFPFDYQTRISWRRAILVFSPSISGLLFVVLFKQQIWFSIAGKGAWNCVSHTFYISDLYAFKGKLYTLSYKQCYPLHEHQRLCELRLSPEPKFTLVETKNPLCTEFYNPKTFVSSYETLYVIGRNPGDRRSLHELDLGEMKWVKPCEKTIREYAFFRNHKNHVVAVKRESWADPWSQLHGRYALSPDTDIYGKNILPCFFTAKMWYFHHECMKVDHIDE